MKSLWPIATLEQITEPHSPITYGVIKPGGEGSVRFVRGGDIADGIVREEDLRTITAEVSDQYKRTLLRGGELLMSLVGQPGQVAVASANMFGANIARQVALIRLRCDVDPLFISYFLRSPDGVAGLGRFTGGSVQQVINLGDLRQVTVPIPPVTEQRRIVAILDEAFEGIASAKANAEKNLKNAGEFFDAHLEQVFSRRENGWVVSKLGEAFTTLTGSTPSKAIPSYFGDFMPLVKPPELIDDVVDDAEDGLSRAGAEVARVLPIGSVMVSCIGNLGKVGINSIPVACNQQINAILPNKSAAIPEFMLLQVLSRPFKKHLIEVASGTTVSIVNKSKFNEAVIILPPLRQQQAIVESLRELRTESRRLAVIFRRKIAALDELKKSLLHQVFSGAM